MESTLEPMLGQLANSNFAISKAGIFHKYFQPGKTRRYSASERNQGFIMDGNGEAAGSGTNQDNKEEIQLTCLAHGMLSRVSAVSPFDGLLRPLVKDIEYEKFYG